MIKAILEFLCPREMIYIVVRQSDGYVVAAFYSSKKAARFVYAVDFDFAQNLRIQEVYITP